MILKKEFKIIKKGWGEERVAANVPSSQVKESGYCLKLLIFKGANEGSMHFHSLKHETFYVLEGDFKIKYIDTENANEHEIDLKAGDILEIPPNNPHRIICLNKGTIVEGSSPDDPMDSFRTAKGDSQRETIPKLKTKKLRKKRIAISEKVIREPLVDNT